jgi:transcriptional regulator with XRE-family HTH domain
MIRAHMESHEVIKEAFGKTTVKQVASAMGLSESQVYKWRESPESGSGSRNPLDRVYELLRATRDLEIVNWLCQQAGGYYVPNLKSSKDEQLSLNTTTYDVISQFSGLMHVISQAAKDNNIDAEESKSIRKEWETLKMFVEAFVAACEDQEFERISV